MVVAGIIVQAPMPGVVPRGRVSNMVLTRGPRSSFSPHPFSSHSGVNRGIKTHAIPTRLNTIPHPRETRYWFYNECVSALEKALEDTDEKDSRLLSIKCTIPELNQNFDVYRVGTLLECVRELTTMLSAKGKRCKVCVQQSLGQGVFCGTPLALSGVRRILQQMDWGDDEVTIGQLGKDQIDECDAYIIISPQNITGHSVVPLIADMVEEASSRGDGPKQIVLINPQLNDIMSSGGVMSVRGRQERMDFVSEFIPAYHFRLLYIGMGPYPIMGALRHVYGGPWEVYRRVDFKEENDGTPRERFDLIQTFESEPDSRQITDAFQKK